MTGVVPEHTKTTASSPSLRRHVFGMEIDAVTMDQAVELVLGFAAHPPPDLVLTPNVDHLLRATRDADFRAICRSGSLVLADGAPVVWASRLLNRPLPERVAGSDLMPKVALAAARSGLRYYFLGGSPGDAERASQVIAEWAGIDGSCGVDCPPMGFENDETYMTAMIERINAAKPDIIFVGLGSPKQEKLMARLRDQVTPGVMMAVGITFSFLAGTVRRAPPYFQRLGLEWLWRVCCEPRRLWRRYVMNLAVFPMLVFREKARHMFSPLS